MSAVETQRKPAVVLVWARTVGDLILANYLVIGFAVACVLGYFFPCMFLSCSCSTAFTVLLSVTHTHTHTHTHSLSHSHSHMFSHTYTLSLAHTISHLHNLSLALTVTPLLPSTRQTHRLTNLKPLLDMVASSAPSTASSTAPWPSSSSSAACSSPPTSSRRTPQTGACTWSSRASALPSSRPLCWVRLPESPHNTFTLLLLDPY